MSYSDLKHPDNLDEKTALPKTEEDHNELNYATGTADTNIGKWSNIYRPIRRFEWQCLLCFPDRHTNIRFDKTSKTNLVRHVKRKHPSSYKQYLLDFKNQRMESRVERESEKLAQHNEGHLEEHRIGNNEEYPHMDKSHDACSPRKRKETELCLSEYFRPTGEFKMQCMLCLKEDKITYIKWCKSSKTNLTRHLRRRHQQVQDDIVRNML